jgi:hypothetical protein
MADVFIDKYRKYIKNAKTDKEINEVLNSVYKDGFEDGANEG